MKSIFNIHISTYIFYLLIILSGYINYFIYYLIIMIVHELGHIIMIKLFKYKILKINIYPFGGIIETNINYNINSNKLFLISIGGILFQLILFIYFKDEIFIRLNTYIILYNLIPIIPTDGSKIILSFIERIFSYKISNIICFIISIFMLFIIFYISKNIFIFVLLYIFNIKFILNINYLFNKFILERYLYEISYNKNKYINSINKIYKCYYNYIRIDNNYIDEKTYYKLLYKIK